MRMRKNARCSSLTAAADLAAAPARGSPARRRTRARRGSLFRSRGATRARQEVRDAGNEPAHGERTDQEPVDALLDQEAPRDVAPSVGVAHHGPRSARYRLAALSTPATTSSMHSVPSMLPHRSVISSTSGVVGPMISGSTRIDHCACRFRKRVIAAPGGIAWSGAAREAARPSS